MFSPWLSFLKENVTCALELTCGMYNISCLFRDNQSNESQFENIDRYEMP